MSRFATTRWSLLLRAASEDDDEARLALAVLCETYWYPVYAYVRCLGTPAADAEDLTQGYFARFLEKRVVRELDPHAGRFRSFLFASVRHFLSNERDRERARKRGGGLRLVSLDAAAAESALGNRLHDGTSPDALFDQVWADTLLERVHQRLQSEAKRRGGLERYQGLRPSLPPAEAEPDYAGLAKAWGVRKVAVRVALHRLRSRFGAILREEIGRTVGSESEVEDERRHLLGALGS